MRLNLDSVGVTVEFQNNWTPVSERGHSVGLPHLSFVMEEGWCHGCEFMVKDILQVNLVTKFHSQKPSKQYLCVSDQFSIFVIR